MILFKRKKSLLATTVQQIHKHHQYLNINYFSIYIQNSNLNIIIQLTPNFIYQKNQLQYPIVNSQSVMKEMEQAKEYASSLMQEFKRSPLPLFLYTGKQKIYWIYEPIKNKEQEKQTLKKLAKRFNILFEVKECISNNGEKFNHLEVLGVDSNGYESVPLYQFSQEIGVTLQQMVLRQFEIGDEFLLINQIIFNKYGCFERKINELQCIICLHKFGFNIWQACCGQNICDSCVDKTKCHFCRRQPLRLRQPEPFQTQKANSVKIMIGDGIVNKFKEKCGKNIIYQHPLLIAYLKKRNG